MKCFLRPALILCAAAILLTLAAPANASGFLGELFGWSCQCTKHAELIRYLPETSRLGSGRGEGTSQVASGDSSAEVAARLKAWNDANGSDSSGAARRVTIVVDGKQVVLEIRVVGTCPDTKPDNGTVEVDSEFAKQLKKEGFDAETGLDDATRSKGASQLAASYENSAAILDDPKHGGTANEVLSRLELTLKRKPQAQKLVETKKIINAHVNDTLKGVNKDQPLSKEDSEKLSRAFKDIAKALRSFQ